MQGFNFNFSLKIYISHFYLRVDEINILDILSKIRILNKKMDNMD